MITIEKADELRRARDEALKLAAGYIADAYQANRQLHDAGDHDARGYLGHLVAKLVDHADDAVDMLDGRQAWRTK